MATIFNFKCTLFEHIQLQSWHWWKGSSFELPNCSCIGNESCWWWGLVLIDYSTLKAQIEQSWTSLLVLNVIIRVAISAVWWSLSAVMALLSKASPAERPESVMALGEEREGEGKTRVLTQERAHALLNGHLCQCFRSETLIMTLSCPSLPPSTLASPKRSVEMNKRTGTHLMPATKKWVVRIKTFYTERKLYTFAVARMYTLLWHFGYRLTLTCTE